jgi:hypothetical protein
MSLVATEPPDATGQLIGPRECEHDYDYFSYQRHVVLSLDEVVRLVHTVTLFLFSSVALDVNSSGVCRLHNDHGPPEGYSPFCPGALLASSHFLRCFYGISFKPLNLPTHHSACDLPSPPSLVLLYMVLIRRGVSVIHQSLRLSLLPSKIQFS